MEAEKLVSVIMPVYNVAGFVLQSIKSVINQSYHYFELIIVDDGSSDNSLQIIKKFLSQNPDPRVKLYYKKNGGLSEARNFGLARANGYYIYFIDSDDFIEKNLLEKSISILQQQNSDMVFFNYFEISSGGNNCSRGETIQVSELTNTQRTAIE
ncbi:glycosyltransferase family 2 protein, partial [Oenococcus oeni]